MTTPSPSRIQTDGSVPPERVAALQAEADRVWAEYQERNRRILEKYQRCWDNDDPPRIVTR